MRASTDPVMRAIFESDRTALDDLLSHGADVHALAGRERWSVLHRALLTPALIPSQAMLRDLIGRGLDVNARDARGYAPLHLAARAQRADVIHLLLASGAEVDPVTLAGETPLRLALQSRAVRADVVEALLSHGADVEHRSPGGSTIREFVTKVGHGLDAAVRDTLQKYGVRVE